MNLTHQMIFSVIPYGTYYAFYRIQKLRSYLLITLSIFLVASVVLSAILIGSIALNIDDPENSLNWYTSLMEYWKSPPFYIISHVAGMAIHVFWVRKWSKEWNKKIETGFFEEASETVTKTLKLVTEIPRIYVASRWKKPNIYFTIPSIYLFISAGILLIGTIVKINDDYFLLSITYGLHLIILSVPSVIGAILLWRRKKIGLIFSNIALVFLSLVIPTSIFGIIQYLPILDLEFISRETGIIFGLSIGLSILMMLFLSKAKKQVVWNKQFSENSGYEALDNNS